MGRGLIFLLRTGFARVLALMTGGRAVDPEHAARLEWAEAFRRLQDELDNASPEDRWWDDDDEDADDPDPAQASHHGPTYGGGTSANEEATHRMVNEVDLEGAHLGVDGCENPRSQAPAATDAVADPDRLWPSSGTALALGARGEPVVTCPALRRGAQARTTELPTSHQVGGTFGRPS